MKKLGIVEGFYGGSLNFHDRNSIVELLSKNSLNYYLYAPKDCLLYTSPSPRD